MRMLRRVVTGHNAEGRSVVLFDGPPTKVVGDRVAELWYTDEVPADNRLSQDTALRQPQMEPPPGGAVFRYIEVAPEIAAAGSDATTAEAFEAMSAQHTLVQGARHAAMHKTDTIDYIVLLSGEVTMLLDEGEVHLKPFDLVIQRGTSHAWVNRGAEPALLLAANISADPVS